MAHYYHETLSRPSSFNFANDVVDYWAHNAPPGPAMHWVSQDRKTERKLSFDHFGRQSHRIAVYLRDKLGVKAGEKMLVVLPRVPEWWEIATAAFRSGIVLCPATTLLVDKDIEYRIHRSAASVFVGDSVSVQKVLRVRANCPSLKHIIQIGSGRSPKEAIHFATALSSIDQNATYTGPKPPISAAALIYFWFVGRSDDVINSSGYRIGPFEVESTLKQHSAVVESAVVSSPEESRGEVVKAFIVLTKEAAVKDHDRLAKELQDFCKEHAAPYKYPRKIQFVDAAFLGQYKTISGKTQRKRLKELEWQGQPKSRL